MSQKAKSRAATCSSSPILPAITRRGVERIGHVALYLGDNYILHTASDYAVIEQISSTRWGYYIEARRVY